jgi:hypothetical protein
VAGVEDGAGLSRVLDVTDSDIMLVPFLCCKKQ